MCHFDANGKRYYPLDRGSGSQACFSNYLLFGLLVTKECQSANPRVVQQFGIPHLFNLPIRPMLSASGDSGMPEVVADPLGEVAKTLQDLRVCVVQPCAKIRKQVSTAVTHDKVIKAITAKVPDSDEEFFLHPTP
ncbi:hypothetical protein EUGRSUZ_C03955 [Eucalyptus grandis]|uniref:Uncharacterized protein n=2 Tax=Eucalyptus grandis TaxID=71139 RepID=A0ACC3LLG3_EUCGR|nr:hypothetical protein EUGRSUZ_C03955 [Eucalyptus grandis]